MIRQTPRLVNLASRSVAAARNADSKQQLALRAFADSAQASTEAKRTVSSPFAKEDIDPLEVFAAIDTNNDGVLQKDEFLRAVDMLNYDEVRRTCRVVSCYEKLCVFLGRDPPAVSTRLQQHRRRDKWDWWCCWLYHLRARRSSTSIRW